MNAIILQNIALILREAETPREPPTVQKKKAMSPARIKYLQYILAHGKATGAELRKNCNETLMLPSMALRQNIRNGTVIFTAAGRHRDGYYTIPNGITPRALGLES